MDDEFRRYIEFLQRNLLTSGFEKAHDTAAFRRWVANNRRQLDVIAPHSGGTAETVDEMERALAQYAPESVFDSFTAEGVSGPILARVLSAASDNGLAPLRDILFANSTDVSPSAAARPSSAEHLIFAGVGTFAFCNYWAKIIAGIAHTFHMKFGRTAMTAASLREVFSSETPLIVEAVRLALYCKYLGSAVGYGQMKGAVATAAFRLELLGAMETFVVGHEVGHCYFEERRADKESFSEYEESACDLYSLTVSRASGNRHNSWIAFNGAGAYLFLRVAAICSPIRTRESGWNPSTHPASKVRAEAVREASIEATEEDQRPAVSAYLRDFQELCDEIESAVAAVLDSAALSVTSDGVETGGASAP